MKYQTRKHRLALIAPGLNGAQVLTPLGQIFVFAATVGLIFLRRPDAFLNPQFWAEDGKLWYADPYNIGLLQTLLLPVVGYFQTLCRITGTLAQFLPLSVAPTLFNAVAILIQALPVNLFLSSRFADRFPKLWARSAFAIVYLLLPNSTEVHANLTNAKWHLALLVLLVVLARPAANLGWRVFDVIVVTLGSVSGPFALFLVPVLAMGYRHSLRSWRGLLIGLLAIGALVQGLSLLSHGNEARSTVALGASFPGFVRILTGQVFLGAIVGRRGYIELLSLPEFEYVVIIAFVLGSMVVGWALAKGPLELRSLVLFASLVLTAELVAPMGSLNPEVRQWQVLTIPGAVGRYWLFPMLAFVGALLWAASQEGKAKAGSVAVGAARVMLLAMSIGIVLDWKHPQYTDFKFSYWVHKVEEAAVGEKIIIPINPKGWTFTLIKREGLRW